MAFTKRKENLEWAERTDETELLGINLRTELQNSLLRLVLPPWTVMFNQKAIASTIGRSCISLGRTIITVYFQLSILFRYVC